MSLGVIENPMTKKTEVNIDEAKFQEAAANAKANCPISRLLHTNITLTAKLAR